MHNTFLTYDHQSPTVFHVEPGKITYPGHYIASQYRGRNLVGIPLQSGAIFAIDDHHALDCGIAGLKLRELKGLAQIDATPDTSKVAFPFFSRERFEQALAIAKQPAAE